MSDGSDGLNPAIDRELGVFVRAVGGGRGPSLTLDQIPFLREQAEGGLVAIESLGRDGVVEVEERFIPGPSGAPELPALIMRPAGRTGPLPCVYYCANGGKVLRSVRVGLTMLEADWVAELGIVFVSVACRVAPEDMHPAQVDDAYQGLSWTWEHAEELGINRDQIIIMGKSGGGGIAAAVSLMTRDRGGPAITHQILVYPMIDDRGVTVSSAYESVFLDAESNRTLWTAMLGDARGRADVSPYAAPSRATELHGLPPTYLEAGSAEVFRDEVIDYAARLGEAGVSTELHVWAGGFHSFESYAPDTEISRAAEAARTSYLRRALWTPDPKEVRNADNEER